LYILAGPVAAMVTAPENASSPKNIFHTANFTAAFLLTGLTILVYLAQANRTDVEHLFFTGRKWRTDYPDYYNYRF
jgi:hypothetical protein